jgi:hypothetical protein
MSSSSGDKKANKRKEKLAEELREQARRKLLLAEEAEADAGDRGKCAVGLCFMNPDTRRRPRAALGGDDLDSLVLTRADGHAQPYLVYQGRHLLATWRWRSGRAEIYVAHRAEPTLVYGAALRAADLEGRLGDDAIWNYSLFTPEHFAGSGLAEIDGAAAAGAASALALEIDAPGRETLMLTPRLLPEDEARDASACLAAEERLVATEGKCACGGQSQFEARERALFEMMRESGAAKSS